jgi:uncharacterized protein
MKTIETLAELEALYAPAPKLASTAKEINFLIPEYRAYIEQSPFMALATAGPEGLDCSPRGDSQNVVKIVDDRTLALPDRRGNNRIDSLRNIIRDSRVGLLFLIPGSGTTFRVNGQAKLTADPDICNDYKVEDSAPRCVVFITIEAAYFQCARAIVRSRLWDVSRHVDLKSVPSPGAVLQRLTKGEIEAKPYDDEWPGRAAKSLW